MQVDIVAELENWGRWVRGGHGGISQCASAEGYFRRNRIPGDTETGWGDYLTSPVPPAPMPMIDVTRALAVERSMRYLPKGHRIALKLRYVRNMTADGICQRLAISYQMWDIFLHHAQLMVRNHLTCKIQRNNLALHAELPHLPRLTRCPLADASGCNEREEIPS